MAPKLLRETDSNVRVHVDQVDGSVMMEIFENGEWTVTYWLCRYCGGHSTSLMFHRCGQFH